MFPSPPDHGGINRERSRLGTATASRQCGGREKAPLLSGRQGCHHVSRLRRLRVASAPPSWGPAMTPDPASESGPGPPGADQMAGRVRTLGARRPPDSPRLSGVSKVLEVSRQQPREHQSNSQAARGPTGKVDEVLPSAVAMEADRAPERFRSFPLSAGTFARWRSAWRGT